VLNKTLQGLVGTVVSFTSGIAKLLLGIIISVYMLYDKEKFIKSIKKFVIGICGPLKSVKIFSFGSEVNEIFYNFFVGKAIDSLIIGILCFIGLSIIKAPYTIFMSLIVGFFNMIPYFGPFIGAVPAIIFTLLTDPVKAIWVTLFIFILQQFDGIILGPKILGNKVGIAPFYIILAIILGGGYFGMLGMLFAVPIFKIIDINLNRSLEKRIKSRGVHLDGMRDLE
ncbi:MAG: AI-2E family transporter, partial [Filifactoraceae bacterium]